MQRKRSMSYVLKPCRRPIKDIHKLGGHRRKCSQASTVQSAILVHSDDVPQHLSAKTLKSQETWDIIEKIKQSRTCVDCQDEVTEDATPNRIVHLICENDREMAIHLPSACISKTIDLSGLPHCVCLHFLNL